ncbi:MAG: allophanate hydrolase [Pseudomonadota bacterium]|nr:allophanate hydrolase [Pseudomonadota bacterium]
MNAQHPTAWTLPDWQAAYQQQQAQPDVLLPQLLQQLDPQDPAWISLCSAAQLQDQLTRLAARLAEVSGEISQLPLYGVPFAVKDNIDVAGWQTTAACPAFAYVAEHDATVIAKLRAAGAIVIGKTNLDQFATGLVGTRSPYGVVPNTFDPAYVAGGSSAGSASVVSRGLVPFSLGTDTAGSGRVPAGFNQIVGLKPTRGWLSTTGVVPACRTLDCVSVFALSVADAYSVARLAGGVDHTDAYSRPHPRHTPVGMPQRPKIAIPDGLDFCGDAKAEMAFAKAMAQLQVLDAELVTLDFRPFAALAKQLYEGSWVAERTAAIPTALLHSDQMDGVVQQIIQSGQQYSAVQAYQAEYIRADLARQIQSALVGVDALMVPTTPTIRTLAEIADEPIAYNSQFGLYTNFTNLADLSALAVPAKPREDGLPFGVTFIAPAWHDRALAALGQRWQQALALPMGAVQAEVSEPVLPVSVDAVRVAVVGAHLTGMPLNFQLSTRDAVLVEQTTTAARYRLYALAGTVPPKPGLVRVAQAGQSLIVELWDVPLARFGEFVAEIPTPLGIGNLELADGRWVKGFICEPYALDSATDISQFGGWRAYIADLKSKNTTSV